MGVLRLLLALTVVLGHNQLASLWFGPGVYMAVKAFFIVSGFYMSLILSGKYESIGGFYASRALRLYPLYLAVLALTWFAAVAGGSSVGIMISVSIWSLVHGAIASLLAFANLTMIGMDLTVLGCFQDGSVYAYDLGCRPGGYLLNNWMLVPQAWSLSVELMFYAIAPFVVRLRARPFVALLIAGLLLRLAIDLSSLNVNTWHRSFGPFEMPYFFLGVAAHRIYQAGYLRHPTFGIALLLATPFYYTLEQAAGVDWSTENPVWWAYFGLITLALPSLFALTKSATWDREIGELSYPIYIVHLLVMGLIDVYLGRPLFDNLGRWGWLALNVTAVIGAGWLGWRLIGVPIDALRARLAGAPRRHISAPVKAMRAVVATPNS